MSRGLKLVYAAAIILAALSLFYVALIQPFFPFDSQSESQSGGTRVLRILNEQSAGGVRVDDLIIALNGQPLPTCHYLFWSPLARKHPGDSMQASVLRSGNFISTQFMLVSPASYDYPYLIVVIVVSALFITSGLLITLSPETHNLRPRFQLGLLGILGGFIILATGSLTGYRAPGSFLYPLGLPVWSLLAIITHRQWPVDQSEAPIISVLFYATIALTMVTILLQLASNAEILCLSSTIARWAEWSLVLMAVVGLLNLVLPLLRSLSRITNPYQEAQIRAILWSVGIGLGVPIVTSMLPEIAGLRSPIQPGFVLGISVVIPISYAVVAYETALIKIERYTAFILFSTFIVVAWFSLSSFAIWLAHRLWNNQPNILIISLFTLVPAFVFTTGVRDFAQRFVDFILYGSSWHYEQHLEETTQQLIRQMEGLPTHEQTIHSLVRNLPSLLHLNAVALWLLDQRTDRLSLVGTFGLTHEQESNLSAMLDLDWIDAGDYSRVGNVTLFHELDNKRGAPWRVALQFRAEDTLLGVLMLGEKLNGQPYSPSEIGTFETITHWVGNNLLTQRLMQTNLAQEQRSAALILEHEENIRQQIVATLHDEGLTHLSRIKNNLIGQYASPEAIDDLQQVIENIREIIRRDVIPSEPLKGLIEAIESYCIERRMEGITIQTSYPEEDRRKWRELAKPIRRALYYAAREAIRNAIKADPEAPIKVLFEIDNTRYRIVINDQGPGFDASTMQIASDTLHYGLAVMKARLVSVEGTLSITSNVGVGTSVTLTGPVKPASLGDPDDTAFG